MPVPPAHRPLIGSPTYSASTQSYAWIVYYSSHADALASLRVVCCARPGSVHARQDIGSVASLGTVLSPFKGRVFWSTWPLYHNHFHFRQTTVSRPRDDRCRTLVVLVSALEEPRERPQGAREEVVGVVGDGELGVEHLPRLVYTRMILDETLRLYPSAWLLSRKAVEDDEVGPYRIPAGSWLFVSPYVTHRRADLWENPEGFDPERFRPGHDEECLRYAYFPFGGAPGSASATTSR